MKQVFMSLSLVFAVLTLCGAGYVLSTHGAANAGCAAAPMVICVALLSLSRSAKK